MKKNDRKIEKSIVKALSEVCDELMSSNVSFCWLTHFVDYADVSHTLRVVCVFDTDTALSKVRDSGSTKHILALVDAQLRQVGVVCADIEKSVALDTEENGADADKTQWCRQYERV